MNINLSRKVKDFEVEYEGQKMTVTMQSITSTETESILFDAQTKVSIMQKQIAEKQKKFQDEKGNKPSKQDIEEITERVQKEFGASIYNLTVESEIKRLLLQIKKWDLKNNGKTLPINESSLRLVKDYAESLWDDLTAKAKEIQNAENKVKETAVKNSKSGQNTKAKK
jgi:hypothetical protein